MTGFGEKLPRECGRTGPSDPKYPSLPYLSSLLVDGVDGVCASSISEISDDAWAKLTRRLPSKGGTVHAPRYSTRGGGPQCLRRHRGSPTDGPRLATYDDLLTQTG